MNTMASATRTARASFFCFFAAFFALLAAGCSQFTKPEQKLEPNIYPANYKTDLVAYFRKNSDDLVNATATYVSTPALKQFGSESRYFVCLRIEGQGWRREKIAIFFSEMINQFVDATSEQCGAAGYQPFPELLAAFGPRSEKK
jgi:hypothetical protein